VEYRVTRSGQRHPDEDELPSIPPEKWPLYNGEVQKPWRDTRLVYIASPRTGEQFTLVVSTWRGRAGVGDLKDAIMNIRMARPAAMPIVRLGTEPRRDRFGVKPGVKFIIDDWCFPATAANTPMLERSARGDSPDASRGAAADAQPVAAPTLSEEMDDSLPF
jgi:hypothetical protein